MWLLYCEFHRCKNCNYIRRKNAAFYWDIVGFNYVFSDKHTSNILVIILLVNILLFVWFIRKIT